MSQLYLSTYKSYSTKSLDLHLYLHESFARQFDEIILIAHTLLIEGLNTKGFVLKVAKLCKQEHSCIYILQSLAQAFSEVSQRVDFPRLDKTHAFQDVEKIEELLLFVTA